MLICLAKQSGLVHSSIFTPDSGETIIFVVAPHTGQNLGTSNTVPFASALIHLGIILLAFIILSLVPGPPIPSLSHSLILHKDALFTVVPSNLTGLKIATGVI